MPAGTPASAQRPGSASHDFSGRYSRRSIRTRSRFWGDIGQEGRDLAVVDPPQRSRVLPLHPDRLRSLLRETGRIGDQDRGRDGQVLHHVVAIEDRAALSRPTVTGSGTAATPSVPPRRHIRRSSSRSSAAAVTVTRASIVRRAFGLRSIENRRHPSEQRVQLGLPFVQIGSGHRAIVHSRIFRRATYLHTSGFHQSRSKSSDARRTKKSPLPTNFRR